MLISLDYPFSISKHQQLGTGIVPDVPSSDQLPHVWGQLSPVWDCWLMMWAWAQPGCYFFILVEYWLPLPSTWSTWTDHNTLFPVSNFITYISIFQCVFTSSSNETQTLFPFAHPLLYPSYQNSDVIPNSFIFLVLGSCFEYSDYEYLRVLNYLKSFKNFQSFRIIWCRINVYIIPVWYIYIYT